MWFNSYVSVGERAVKAQRKINQLKKKNPNINPIVIEGKQIAKSWWGKIWINHLKHYADYDNRVARGRSYVKNGLVVHFAINQGHIEAMVMGSRSSPYKVKITTRKLSSSKWNKIKQLSREHLYTLPDLVEGRLPEKLKDIFSDREEGLFPSLKEMDFNCSCPDWAEMCKHVSASLFALGAEIDNNIDLFFMLRGVNASELVQSALQEERKSLKKRKSLDEVNVLKISDNKLASLFDIELVTPKSTQAKKVRRKKSRRKTLH